MAESGRKRRTSNRGDTLFMLGRESGSSEKRKQRVSYGKGLVRLRMWE